MLFPNDVTLDKRGNVYATDTSRGAVWRISPRGSAEVWADHPLLKGSGAFGFGFPIGANGIALRHNTIIVANTERGLLVALPIEPDGSAGAPTVLAESPALVGPMGSLSMSTATSTRASACKTRSSGSMATGRS